MFIFFFEREKIKPLELIEDSYIFYEVGMEINNKNIQLSEVPSLEIAEEFPSYYEWYGFRHKGLILICRVKTELLFRVREGLGLSDLEYYERFKNRKILERESCYRLVKKHFDKYREQWIKGWIKSICIKE